MSNTEAKDDLSGRERRMDMSTMSPEEVEALSARIGVKAGLALKEATDKIKRMLAVYGLDIKLVYVIHQLGMDAGLTDTPVAESVEAPVITEEKKTKAKAKPRKKRASKGDKIDDGKPES